MFYSVFRDIIKAERFNKNNKTPLLFMFFVFFLPAVLTYFLISNEIKFSESSIGTTVNLLSIFVGFLITSTIPFFEITANGLSKINAEKSESAEDEWKVINRKKIFKIIFPSIIYSIFSALVGLMSVLILSFIFVKDGPNDSLLFRTMSSVCYFFISSCFFNILMIINRLMILINPFLEENSKDL